MRNRTDPYYSTDEPSWYYVFTCGAWAIVDCSVALLGMGGIWYMLEVWFRW